jgi:nickel-dependent lactate racemase
MCFYKLKYGNSFIEVPIHNQQTTKIIEPPLVASVRDPNAAVLKSLNNPIFCKQPKVISPGQTIGIAINDKTRPVPHDLLLLPLLSYLLTRGIRPNDITFFIASGTHSPMLEIEYPKVLPNNLSSKFRVISHDCDDLESLEYLGTTQMGTPVYVNKQYFRSNIKIVVGNIEPHHFMGFSGGMKSAAIGLAGRETINQNHSHLVDDNSHIGTFSTNPCRNDVEEIGQLMGIDYALNVVLNSKREIVNSIWGDPSEVISKGIEISRGICQVKVSQRFDCVIASAGGYPKDINLYQSQKALTNAAEIAKDGGDIYLIAACVEGAGNSQFVKFLEGITSPREALDKFITTGFSVGPHKAFQIARIAARTNIHLISTMDDTLAQKLLFDPISINDLVGIAKNIKSDQTLAIMPNAVITIPLVTTE